MTKTSKMTLNGKVHLIEEKEGVTYVDNLPIDEFLDSLDFATLCEMATVGVRAFRDKEAGITTTDYQEILNQFNIKKNN